MDKLAQTSPDADSRCRKAARKRRGVAVAGSGCEPLRVSSDIPPSPDVTDAEITLVLGMLAGELIHILNSSEAECPTHPAQAAE